MGIGDGIETGLNEGVEMLENCGEVEWRRKILNNSSWGRAHDPVLSLGRGESVKRPKERPVDPSSRITEIKEGLGKVDILWSTTNARGYC